MRNNFSNQSTSRWTLFPSVQSVIHGLKANDVGIDFMFRKFHLNKKNPYEYPCYIPFGTCSTPSLTSTSSGPVHHLIITVF